MQNLTGPIEINTFKNIVNKRIEAIVKEKNVQKMKRQIKR